MLHFKEKLEGTRIVLERPELTFALAEEVFAAVDASRETLRIWLEWVDETLSPEDEFRNFFEAYCYKNWEAGKSFPYIIREKSTRKFCGVIDFFNISELHKRGEIGYWLSDSAVGHGYMAEALGLLEQEVFSQGMNRIFIQNVVENLRSVHVAARAGYHLDGVLRQQSFIQAYRRFCDMNVWSKLKGE